MTDVMAFDVDPLDPDAPITITPACVCADPTEYTPGDELYCRLCFPKEASQ